MGANTLPEPPYYGFDPDSSEGVAIERVQNILRTRVAAIMRTLEVKIAECGQKRVLPHVITFALKYLEDLGVVIKERRKSWPCEVFYLAGTDRSALWKARSKVLRLARKWNKIASRSSRNAIGVHGENIVGMGIAACANLTIRQWGNVTQVGAIPLPIEDSRPGSADGLISTRATGFADAVFGLVEVKNGREYITATSLSLWKIIRKGYATGTVPILIARMIYRSAISFALARVGGFGLSTYCQFAPPRLADKLIECRHTDGLGFKDLDFSNTVPDRMAKMLDILAAQMPNRMRRLIEVRHIVEPYLDTLADAAVPQAQRDECFRLLQADLDHHDGLESSYGRLVSNKRRLNSRRAPLPPL